MKFLLIVLLSITPALQAAASVTAVPSAAVVNQVVTLVAMGDVSSEATWSIDGGEWCLFAVCFWRSDDDLISPGSHPLWRARTAGTYTITMTPPEGSAVTATVIVTDP